MSKNKATVTVSAVILKKKNADFNVQLNIVCKFGSDKTLKKTLTVKNVLKSKPNWDSLISKEGMKLMKRSPSFQNFNTINKN